MGTKQKRGVYVAMGVLMAVAAIAFALSGNRAELNDSGPQLPGIIAYDRLPKIFNEHLARSHAHVRSRPHDMEAVRKLACLYHANGLYREARECYQFLTASSAGLIARDHYYLADIAQHENNLAQAQVELRATLAAEPDYVPARLSLANALFKAGDAAAAGREYSTVLERVRDQPQASLGLARIELQQREDDAALARLEELMAAHPDATSAAALLAQILERMGQTDRAVAVAQWSLQKPESPPPDPWLAELLTDCYDIQRLSIAFEESFKMGKMDDALPLLNRLTELDPDSPTTKIFRGFSHARAGRHSQATQEFREALAKGGDPEKICPYLVQSLIEQGKNAEAESMLAGYFDKMPESIPIAKAYSDVALRSGNDKLAAGLLAKVLAKEPYLYPQNMSLAKILWTSGERDEASKCLHRVASVYASDIPSRALLGEYYLAKSDPATAMKFLEEAFEHAQTNTPAQTGLATLLGVAHLQAGHRDIEKGHLQQAANHYENATRFAPADVEAYAGKANALVQLKQFSRAAEALEKLTSLLPDNPTIYLSLGDVLYQAGERAEAGRHWGKALQLSAQDDRELRRALDERLAGRITEETFR